MGSEASVDETLNEFDECRALSRRPSPVIRSLSDDRGPDARSLSAALAHDESAAGGRLISNSQAPPPPPSGCASVYPQLQRFCLCISRPLVLRNRTEPVGLYE